MVLLAYDGSPDAKAAIQDAAMLLGGQPAIVLTVWRPFAQVILRTPAGLGPMAGPSDIESIDAESERQAEELAEEGAGLAVAAGLSARPRTARRETTTAQAILVEAGRTTSSAIIMGSRGRSGLRSMLLGSVSQAVLYHADRPVLVVPSPEVARGRSESLRALEALTASRR